MGDKLAVGYNDHIIMASLVAQMAKNLPAMHETQVWSLGREDPLEEGMATHSSILAWRIPWTEEPGKLVCACMHAKLLQSCLTLCDPMDRSLPGSSVQGILQAWILECSRGLSLGDSLNPGIKLASLLSSALASRFFTTRATWEAHNVILFSH